MRDFPQLTPRGQVRRLRPVALASLAAFGLKGASVTFINHGENTTWQIDLPRRPRDWAKVEGLHPTRCLLRIHRTSYNWPNEIASELMWLEALGRDTDLVVPAPLRTRESALVIERDIEGLNGPRVITATRWVEGRMLEKRITSAHYEALGTLMAQLHDHASGWKRPRGFTRARWSDRGLATESGNTDRGHGDIWPLVPTEVRRVFRKVRTRILKVMESLGEGPEAYGLIHGDLHMHNVVFHGGTARALDFDDAMFAPWLLDLAIATYGRPQAVEPMLRGYRRIRPLPEPWVRHLPSFWAARHAWVMMWLIGRAQVNSRFAGIVEKHLPGSVARCEGWLRER